MRSQMQRNGFNLKRGGLALGLLFSFTSLSGKLPAMSVESVSGPTSTMSAGLIQRSATFRQGEKVLWGRCDFTEHDCNPSSDSLVLEREMSFIDYQNHLAERFDIEPKYLIYDEKGKQSLQNGIELAKRVAQSEAENSISRQKINRKMEVLSKSEGIFDRFLQALAIKRSLEWDEQTQTPKVTFDKSLESFEKSLWPINFAKPIEPVDDPLVIYEPSTELTWHFVGDHLTFSEAISACQKINGRLPKVEELLYSNPWLYQSAIGSRMKAQPQEKGPTSKNTWLDSFSYFEPRFVFDRKEMVGNERYQREITVKVYHFDLGFNFAKLYPHQVSTSTDKVETNEESIQRGLEYQHGHKTQSINGLCVVEAKR